MLSLLGKSIAVAITVAGPLLAYVGIYASEPNRWTETSLIWSLTIGASMLGIISGLIFAVWSISTSYNKAQKERDDALSRSAYKIPKAIRCIKTARDVEHGRLTVLLEPSNLFGAGTDASIYTRQDGIEILIGVGYIATVQQEGGNLQMRVTRPTPGHDALWIELMNNRVTALAETFVRPGGQADER